MDTEYLTGRAGATATWSLTLADYNGAVDLSAASPTFKFVVPGTPDVDVTGTVTPDADQVTNRGLVSISCPIAGSVAVGRYQAWITVGVRVFPTSRSQRLNVEVLPAI